MSEVWKFVGGVDDGREVEFTPETGEDVVWYGGFRYVVRPLGRVLLFSPDGAEMVERAALIKAMRKISERESS